MKKERVSGKLRFLTGNLLCLLRTKRYYVGAFCLILSVLMAAAVPQVAVVAAESTSEASAILDGWHGKKYYRNGVALTGRRTIDGKVYYFDENGNIVTGWMEINGKLHYFSKKSGEGIRGAALTGLSKINGSYYYFSSNGVLKTGWRKINGRRYYFRESGKVGVIGSAYSGLKKIDGAVYYFNSKGAVKTGWYTFENGRSWFDSKGVRATGITKISGNYYYFTSKGIQVTETKTVGSTTYYFDVNGCLEAYKTGSTYYQPDGTAMTSLEVTSYETLLRAKAVIAEITTSDMTQAQKLKACFDWVISKPYKTYRKFSPVAGWPATYANDHFVRGGGDCHADGSAFAYLAKALGYTEVYVCNDSNGITAQGHCWTEIDGKVYDPLFAEAKSYSKYYGCSYTTYVLRPILHIAI